ncbi:MAG: tryptophan synthase subunit alpha [candidate division Zixibacteria bacterium]|nr:tryptophan synthase subunit alpha [candidate division Zixibacteria bacterium]
MTQSTRRRHHELTDIFADARPVIPFITAGYPTKRVFQDTIRAAVDAGAGAVEIGMPFSDPLADGPAIQLSSQVALEHGIDLPEVLKLTEDLRRHIDVPLILMGYLNPLMQMGFERFARRAVDAGVSGTIIPDCPVGEAKEWRAVSRDHGLANIFLIAPTTTDERIAVIDRASTAFSYCVSVAGVTGARGDVAASTRKFLQRVAAIAKKPYVVGFGISAPRHIKELKHLAHGFVVGSALVRILRDEPAKMAPLEAHRFIRSLVRAAK